MGAEAAESLQCRLAGQSNTLRKFTENHLEPCAGRATGAACALSVDSPLATLAPPPFRSWCFRHSGKAPPHCPHLTWVSPPFCSSCDSCSIEWLWQQRKQLGYGGGGTQAASQKVKWREAHRPLRNSESCVIFFSFHKSIESKRFWVSTSFLFFFNVSVFYIARCTNFIQKHNPMIFK